MDPNLPQDQSSPAPEPDPHSEGQAQPAPTSETAPEPAPIPTRERVDMLEDQYQFLETVVALSVSALIVLSLGLNLFLFKQMRLARGQVYGRRPAVTALTEEFHQKREPIIRNLVGQLESFATTNADFKAVLESHRLDLRKYFKPLDSPAPDPVPSAPEPAK